MGPLLAAINQGCSQKRSLKSFSQVSGVSQANLLPVSCVVTVAAKALYDYDGNNIDELSFNEGDIISIIDKSGEEWWKAERDGVVYIVPATYVEIVEG